MKVEGTDFARLEYIAVQSAYRKQGIAKALLESMLYNVAKDKEVKRIFLSVDVGSNAVSVYRQAGFEETLQADMYEMALKF